MCAMLDLVDKKVPMLSSSLRVACMRLPYVRITCGNCFVFNVFTECVSTLM